MIALTSRLNERDETIISLQEEIENASKANNSQEQQSMEKSSRCNYLESLLDQHNIKQESNNENSFVPLMNSNNYGNQQLQQHYEDKYAQESRCLRETLTIVKNFLERNDRKTFIENVDNLNKK